ncbi:methyl-accepting chemotaxis protein [Eubacteriales bacterium OttesenSCG-928-M02]|nr:methyl-accepting chemotaxis protein [Eubacteriales bacterium OttesenSCG-928-M02]
MRWYQDRKVSTKLVIGFTMVMTISLIIGGALLYLLLEQRSTQAETFENYGNSQGYLGYIIGAYQEQYVGMSDIILFNTPEDIEESLGFIADYGDEIQEYLEKYEATCVSEEDKREYETIASLIDDFNGILDEYTALAEQGRIEDCLELFTSDRVDTVCVALTDALFTAEANNVKQAEEKIAQQSAYIMKSVYSMLGVIGVAVALIILSVFYIARAVSKPLKGISKLADQLAVGNTNIDLAPYFGKDETGQVAHSFAGVVSSINGLIADMDMLETAAAEGRLSTRADADAHQGDYGRIIKGVNNTLDAVIAPIEEAAAVLDEMSNGNLSVTVAGDYQGDHARIKDALNNTISSLNRYIKEISETLSAMSQGDFTTRIKSEFSGDFMALKDAINAIGMALNQVLARINEAAVQVSAGTQQVSDGAQSTSQGATEQASSIEELTATITQIAEQTRENAEKATQNSTQAQEIGRLADNGTALMGDLEQSMNEINAASQNINNIIKVIEDIAFKTNILALNAAVEAAHAGVHGQGFAVVAEEVRDLAAQSAQAASQTTELIESSVIRTQEGAKLAAETSAALGGIAEAVVSAGQAISEIAEASNQQATGIAQINKGIEQLSQVVQTNSATAQEAAAASQELSSQAAMLREMVDYFTFDENEVLPPELQREYETNTTIAPAQGEDAEMRQEINIHREGPLESAPSISLSDTDFGKY